MEQIVRGPVVRDLLEADPRSVSERRDRPKRVHVGAEFAPVRPERRIAVHSVAHREIERDRWHEGDAVPLRRGGVVPLLPGGADLRNGPMGFLRKLDFRVRGEIELPPALFRDDPIVREEGTGSDDDAELAGPADPELRSEEVVVLRGEPQAHRALLAVEHPDELPDFRIVFHLYRHRREPVQVRDEVLRQEPVVADEEGADQPLAYYLGEGGDFDRLLDVMPVPEEPHLTTPFPARTIGQIGPESAWPVGASRRFPSRRPYLVGGSRGRPATDTSSRPPASCRR